MQIQLIKDSLEAFLQARVLNYLLPGLLNDAQNWKKTSKIAFDSRCRCDFVQGIQMGLWHRSKT